MTPARVVVVDDQTLVRMGITSLLGLSPDIEVIGEAAAGIVRTLFQIIGDAFRGIVGVFDTLLGK